MANPYDKRFSHRFLIVTPGIGICDRLRVLLPRVAIKVMNHYGDEVMKVVAA